MTLFLQECCKSSRQRALADDITEVKITSILLIPVMHWIICCSTTKRVKAHGNTLTQSWHRSSKIAAHRIQWNYLRIASVLRPNVWSWQKKCVQNWDELGIKTISAGPIAGLTKRFHCNFRTLLWCFSCSTCPIDKFNYWQCNFYIEIKQLLNKKRRC